MEKDLFTNLPLEIKIEILSWLPIGSAIKCKLVDRSWGSMIESPEFAKSYKSAPCLAVSKIIEPTPLEYSCKVYEVEDRDAKSKGSCKEAFNLSFPHHLPVHISANGLLYMSDPYQWESHDMYICNPVTREYITITSPEYEDSDLIDSYGFGTSRKSGQLKVVRVFDKFVSEKLDDLRAGCQVYTLGTGLWRSVALNNRSFEYDDSIVGKFLNGNIHWLAYDEKGTKWISCFDLETELFTTLCTPRARSYSLRVLRDCLGMCDYSSQSETIIWLMKDYGDDKSWTKQYVIPSCRYGIIQVFNDGDILLSELGKGTLCYSNKTKAIEETHLIQVYENGVPIPVLYTPSFLPLVTFSSTENVRSF